MGKEVKKDKYVKLSRNANIFFDAKTGITVYRGKPVKLNPYQLATQRVRQAIANGHLEYTDGPEEVEEVDTTITNKEKFEALVEKGLTPSKIAKKFKLPELVELAAEYDIEAEANDTTETLAEAIIEKVKS